MGQCILSCILLVITGMFKKYVGTMKYILLHGYRACVVGPMALGVAKQGFATPKAIGY